MGEEHIDVAAIGGGSGGRGVVGFVSFLGVCGLDFAAPEQLAGSGVVGKRDEGFASLPVRNT